MRARPTFLAAAVMALGTFLLAACGGDDVATPSDPTLARGQQVYRQNCASCHGTKGDGGSGPRLAGVVTGRYPNIDDQIAVIAEGRAGMPAFGERLSQDDMAAVAAYERSL
jgi:mono/diheme cytochrome c family protein